ncbi:hypothetical protein BBK36DRAFT_1142975 [Trichoderma citrinoviride]|uniref:Uncharacterized protein n=1 Tax=Trichoderma citrinoviride TaxID=58853 RepID=A0A2T4B4K9_9HYPO|nr:hypothetical protein BBK36DRAFT_1142975 [Trichoderma citrinoviride]PTB64141.1 hypothetical protein BBK36DRAFT_1142975 [Trichoderma citrinoviride]
MYRFGIVRFCLSHVLSMEVSTNLESSQILSLVSRRPVRLLYEYCHMHGVNGTSRHLHVLADQSLLFVGDSQAAYGLDVRCPVEESKCWTVAMKPLAYVPERIASAWIINTSDQVMVIGRTTMVEFASQQDVTCTDDSSSLHAFEDGVKPPAHSARGCGRVLAGYIRA